MARTVPDAIAIIGNPVFVPGQPVIEGTTVPQPNALLSMAQNLNHAHILAHKTYLVQPCQTAGEIDALVDIVTTALEAAPDLMYVWRLDHLMADHAIRLKWNYKTVDGAIGFKFWYIDADANTTELYSDFIDSAGGWQTTSHDFDDVELFVADSQNWGLLCFGIYESTVNAELSLKQIVAETYPINVGTVGSGIRPNDFYGLDTVSWDAHSPLASGHMQIAIDNLAVLLSDQSSTFACWSECFLKARADDLFRAAARTTATPLIAKIPCRYMPGVTRIKYAICGYYGAVDDTFKIFSDHEANTTKPEDITERQFAVASGAVDPTNPDHWLTGSTVVKATVGEMGETFLNFEFLAEAGGCGVIGLTVWE